jgi:hypothetical protein
MNQINVKFSPPLSKEERHLSAWISRFLEGWYFVKLVAGWIREGVQTKDFDGWKEDWKET